MFTVRPPSICEVPSHLTNVLRNAYRNAEDPGADPERNLIGAQPKARGCGYMGVALSMGVWIRINMT